MKTIKILLIALMISMSGTVLYAQNLPGLLGKAIDTDNAEDLGRLVNKDSINNCYGSYTLLSHAIRANAGKCFDLLISLGADINKICNEYKAPAMHAVKYGRLAMLKVLVKKGADMQTKYGGSTLMDYAERYHKPGVLEYLKSLKQ